MGADASVMTARSGYAVLASTLGVAAAVLTVASLITGWPMVLAALVLLTTLLYVMATVRHALGAMPMARPVITR